MWKIEKDKDLCPRCREQIDPGLMNLAKHWVTCSKNPKPLKILQTKSILIDELKKQSKL